MGKISERIKLYIGVSLLLVLLLILASSFYLSWKYDVRWIDFIRYNGALTDDERAFLKERTLKLGSDSTAPPISSFNEEKGQYEGLIVDYMHALSIELETPIRIQMYPFYDLVEALRQGEIHTCDVFPSASRAKEFNFSLPIYKLKTLLIYPLDQFQGTYTSNLSGKKVVLPKGDLAGEYLENLYKESRPDAMPELISVDSTEEVLSYLEEGKADVGISDEAVLYSFWQSFLSRTGGGYVLETLYEKDVVFAFDKQDTLLQSIMNKGIFQLKKKDILAKAQQKWFGLSQSIEGERSYVRLIMAILILIFALIAVFYLWNQSLKKRVEEKTKELHDMHGSLRRILDHLGTGLAITDQKGILVESNATLVNMLEEGDKEIIGKPLSTIPLLGELLDQRLDRDWKDKIERKGRVYRLVKSAYIQDQERRILYSIADVSEQELVEKQLRQETKMVAIGQLSAGLAHEIRNPLGVIRNGLFILGKNEQMPRSLMSMMEESVDRVNALISTMLDMAKVNKDEKSTTNISDLVQGVLSLYQARIRKGGIQVEIIGEGPNVWPVYIESMKTILLNLVDNALDSLCEVEGERKLIVSWSDQEKFMLSVEDSGKGISEEEKEWIFNPFYTTKSEQKGTGLGLYMVYNEVQSLGGVINVFSLEKGSRFVLLIDKR